MGQTLDLTLGVLRTIDRTASTADIEDALGAELRHYGIEHMIACLVPAPNAPRHFHRAHILLNTYPAEWMNRYIARGYADLDPVLDHVRSQGEPFFWADIREGCRGHAAGERVFDEASDFRLREGIAVPLGRFEGVPAIFGFCGERMQMQRSELANLRFLASIAFARLMLVQSPGPVKPAIRLTPREREALQWMAEGKSNREIGALMRISPHGVDHHLRSVRRKLGTANRALAVATALRLGLIP